MRKSFQIIYICNLNQVWKAPILLVKDLSWTISALHITWTLNGQVFRVPPTNLNYWKYARTGPIDERLTCIFMDGDQGLPLHVL